MYKQIFTREFFSACQTILQAFLFSSMRARSTVHGLFLDPITLISLVQSTSHKLLTTQFHPDFCHFLPVRSKYLPDQTVVELPQPVFHLQCDRHVSQPYTLRESIIICNIFNLYSATYSTNMAGHKDGHRLPSSAEDKNACSYPCNLPFASWRARGQFHFYVNV